MFFDKSKLYRKFIEKEKPEEVEKSFTAELEKTYGITPNHFKAACYNDERAIEVFTFNDASHLINAFQYFQIDNMDYILKTVIRYSIQNKSLHKILKFKIVEENLYNMIRDSEDIILFIDTTGAHDYLFRVLYPKEYLLNHLTNNKPRNNLPYFGLSLGGISLGSGKK